MKKRWILLSFLLLSALLLAACGQFSKTEEPVDAHAPDPTTPPTPTPTRYVELTFYESQSDVVIDGNAVTAYLASGMGDTLYIPLENALYAVDSSLDPYDYIGTSTIRKNYTFTYDGRQYILLPDSNVCTIDGEEHTFPDKTIEYSNRERIYVSVDSFADIVGMQIIYDESYDTFYITEKNDFAPTPGVKVPVICFYGVSTDTTEGSTSLRYNHSLFVDQDKFSRMLEALLNNGYEPIFFEDLNHLEDYTKPVILIFCTSASRIYTTAFPLLKSYMVKANVFAYPDEINTDYSLSMSQLKEMYKSGFVSIQGGGILPENDGVTLSETRQQINVKEAALIVLRATGQLPVAYSYGSIDADYSDAAWELAKEYFSLGVTTKEGYTTYITGQDDIAIPVQRFFSYNTVDYFTARLVDPAR